MRQLLVSQSYVFFVFVARSFAEMETQREKSATPTRDHVTPVSAAADDDDCEEKKCVLASVLVSQFSSGAV